jgi:proline dehydrogenase
VVIISTVLGGFVINFIFVLQLISMEVLPSVHFDDTAVAFSYKSDRDLRKADLIFAVVNHPLISSLATRAVRTAFRLHLPVNGLIKTTVFEHFCGGETIQQSEETIQKLARFHVGTILDYSVEGAKTEAGFNATAQEILNTFDQAATNPNVPFCVFKVTGMADMALLEKARTKEGLTMEEHVAFDRVKKRVDRICSKAYESNVPVLIDAEDSWIQDTIDSLTYEMMSRYNKKKAIIFNTFQMYRADMLGNLQDAYRRASGNGYYLGVKLVRGAYMEKERKRAAKLGYPDPINPTRTATDAMFNNGLSFCIDKSQISLVCGSHNEFSNQHLTGLMRKHGLNPNDARVWFAQLLGMSDNISFNLAKAGYNVAKYVPYGPVEAVMPYLLRRANENTSAAGQSSRELALIRKELRRRRSGR